MSQIPAPSSFLAPSQVGSLFAPLTLPNGAVIPNRLAKAAMEENMAQDDALPGKPCWRSTTPGPRAGPG
jgi:2,4-dienoyl-CoA reductase-like NADH-dependent reductase (Old Yellow Enzyme family)